MKKLCIVIFSIFAAIGCKNRLNASIVNESGDGLNDSQKKTLSDSLKVLFATPLQNRVESRNYQAYLVWYKKDAELNLKLGTVSNDEEKFDISDEIDNLYQEYIIEYPDGKSKIEVAISTITRLNSLDFSYLDISEDDLARIKEQDLERYNVVHKQREKASLALNKIKLKNSDAVKVWQENRREFYASNEQEDSSKLEQIDLEFKLQWTAYLFQIKD